MEAKEFYNIRVGDRVLSDRPFPPNHRLVLYGVYNRAADGQDNPRLSTVAMGSIFQWEAGGIEPFDPDMRLPYPYTKYPLAIGEPAFAWPISGHSDTYQDYLKVYATPTASNLYWRLWGLYKWIEPKPEQGRPYWPRWWKVLRMVYEIHRGEGHQVVWMRDSFVCSCMAVARRVEDDIRYYPQGLGDIEFSLGTFGANLINRFNTLGLAPSTAGPGPWAKGGR